jgi:phage terminase large subunit-like protein
MTADELELFREVADREPPTKPVRELWIVAGRRGGKDSIAAAIATVAALGDYRPYLRTGERATVMCLASDRQQAAIVHRYIAGYFRELPALVPLVQRETDELLELRNNVDVVIASNNLRAPRGRAIAVAIMDEVAYWRGADSASPDTETFAAIEPATLTIPNALIIGISSPYRRSGLLFQKWSKHYGKPCDDVLVVRGTSKMFNPTLPDTVIEARWTCPALVERH